MAGGGNPPMTRGGITEMLKPSFEQFAMQVPSASRPSMPSHQSNSLPSTPYIPARELSDDCRTPSPIAKGAEMTLPRSARSESDTGTRPSARAPFLAGCKYETGMTFSRRRIPYSIGGDKLERASSTPKKQLDPNEENKLSGDMRELYNRILPSAESEERRARFTKKLEKILNRQWPGSNIQVHVFGSSGNLLCTTDSDVDICITTSMKALERVCLLAKTLADHGMERVICVPHAKVPIVKAWDPELELACDMNVNNTLALENTRMIKTYVQIDERVRPLAMVIKHWTRRRVLNDAALGGTLSSYTWICMIINFLQTRKPPVLPCLHQRPHQRLVDASGTLSSFADDIETLRGFGSANTETIGGLLFHFFRRYAHELDFDKHVISIRDGSLISKQAKKWHLMQNNRLCVEEPFNIERNLGNTVDDISFRGVHLELRRAFDLLCQSKLSECCEEYIFPAIEEKIWSKPIPQPRPVLSRSLSQSGRAAKGGPTSRGGHNTQRHRAGTSNRRASSAAASNNNNLNWKMNHLSGGSVSSAASGGQIHEQLIQQMTFLQNQEAQLRLQMHQRQQATIHAHITAQAHMQPQPQGHNAPHHLNLDMFARQRNYNSGPMSAPLHSIVPSNGQIQIANYSPHPSIHTNPSSPSMASAQLVQPELRRSLHRSTTTDNNFATMRSHSQPASDMRTHTQTSRSAPGVPFAPTLQGSLLGYNSLHEYQQAILHNQQLAEMQQANAIAAMSPRLTSMRPDPRGDDMRAHHPEYVGYYVEHLPARRPHEAVSVVPHIPAYRDLAHHTRGVSPSLTRLRSHTSRSPSPSSLGSQDQITSFYSAVSAQPASPDRTGSAIAATGHHSGPIIVDGSSETSTEYMTASEHLSVFHSKAGSDAASLSDGPPINTPLTTGAPTPTQDPLDTFDLDTEPEFGYPFSVPSILQFGDFPVRSTRRASPPSGQNINRSVETDSAPHVMPREHITVQPAMVSNSLGIDFDEHAPGVNPESASSPRASSVSKVPPKLETSSSDHKTDRPPVLKSLPLLSPVREVRTPSPTAKRGTMADSYSKILHSRSVSALSGSEFMSSPLSIYPNGKERAFGGDDRDSKTNGINGVRGIVNGSSSSGSDIGSSSGANNVPNSPLVENKASSSGWQQTVKKGKKSKNKGSISSLSEVIVGERKGG